MVFVYYYGEFHRRATRLEEVNFEGNSFKIGKVSSR